MKNNGTMILSMASALLISLSACGNMDNIDNTSNPNVVEGNMATLYTTTANGSATLKKTFSQVASTVNMAPTTIQVDPSKTYQSMDGFGVAIRYASCYDLMKMD